MAVLGEIRPWHTETPGERLFLLAYDLAKSGLPISPTEQPWIVSVQGLSEFLRLVVAMELTHRCLNSTVEVIEANPTASSDAVMRELRRSVQLYGSNRVLGPIAEQSRLAAIASVNRTLTDGRKNTTHRDERQYCCWCGTHTSRRPDGSQTYQATIEHLWPEFLGGTSVAENLTIACKECNSARQHAFTWAWFGLQACNEKLDGNGRLPRPIYLALALNRLIRVASGQTKLSKVALSLKGASKILKGAMPQVTLRKDRRYTFFEILQMSKE
jgi:5-methylcytosine-specific restriction endonuclease McrA